MFGVSRSRARRSRAALVIRRGLGSDKKVRDPVVAAGGCGNDRGAGRFIP
jgi:hypothetical protein